MGAAHWPVRKARIFFRRRPISTHQVGEIPSDYRDGIFSVMFKTKFGNGDIVGVRDMLEKRHTGR